MDFDLHGRPPFVPPPLLELDEWPPCSLELDLHQKLSQNLVELISHTQAREIQCLECLGKGHLASNCSKERSMILRNKDEYSSQEKETSESEENERKKKKDIEKLSEGLCESRTNEEYLTTSLTSIVKK